MAMIFNMAGGGGGLGLDRLNVVGGTTKPTSPTKNTIWINTNVAISKYVLSSTQPETSADGLVWLMVADNGREIDVGQKNSVLLHLAEAKLYSNGAWNMVESHVYTGTKWVQLGFLPLYVDGVFNTDHLEIKTKGSITYGETYYTVTTTGGNTSEVYVVLGPVSLSVVSTIKMRAKKKDSQSNTRFVIMAAKNATSKRSTADAKIEDDITDNLNEHTTSLDVSSLTGDGWYIYAGTNTGGSSWNNSRSVDVYEVGMA